MKEKKQKTKGVEKLPDLVRTKLTGISRITVSFGTLTDITKPEKKKGKKKRD
jgi:DNA repair photolyase